MIFCVHVPFFYQSELYAMLQMPALSVSSHNVFQNGRFVREWRFTVNTSRLNISKCQVFLVLATDVISYCVL